MYGRTGLPEDMVFEILSWLPAGSLIRFKRLKKSVRDLIENPNFATKHLRRQNRFFSGDSLLLIRRFSPNPDVHDHRFSLFNFADDNKNTSSVVNCVDFPFFSGNCELKVSGYCDGIICLSDGKRYIALANPAIRQFRALPSTCISFPNPGIPVYTCYSGFGYDPVSGDYKVVRFFRSIGSRLRIRAEVYTLSTDSWREINCDLGIQQTLMPSLGKYFNGAYYWCGSYPDVEIAAHGRRNVVSQECVIVFDFSKEVFSQINGPSENSVYKSPFIMDESLVLVSCPRATCDAPFSFEIQLVNGTGGDDKSGIELAKLETIGPLHGVKRCMLVFWKNSEVLFESWDHIRIVSYKKGRPELRLLPIFLTHNHRLPDEVQAEVYASSLISVAPRH